MKNFILRFEEGRVSGNGADKVGVYTIEGVYSEKTRRMGLDKKYILGTGDPKENLGHTVKIRLNSHAHFCDFNEEKSAFSGDWYVKTHKYEGCGDWFISRCGEINAGKHKIRNKDNQKYQEIEMEEVYVQ